MIKSRISWPANGQAAASLVLCLWLTTGSSAVADEKARIDQLEQEVILLKQTQSDFKKELAALKGRLRKGGGAQERVQNLDKPVINTESDPSLGSDSAKLVMIEFSDYQCPFCKRHSQQVWPKLKEQYVDTGKIKYLFHDFPLIRIHKEAALAAQAASCAGDQNQYWEMHDRLFENAKNIQPVAGHADALGLELTKFNECIDSKKYAAEVDADIEQALELGIRSTPSFVFGIVGDNGDVLGVKLLRGALPFEKFMEEIDALLKKHS